MTKDFSKANTDRVYDTISDATAEPTEQEKIKARKAHKAQVVQEIKDIQEAQETRKTRKTYTEAEALEFMQSRKTSGRKGAGQPRINMAFTPENYEYIKAMARVRGQSMTDFMNDLIHNSMVQNEQIYKQAMSFRDSLQ